MPARTAAVFARRNRLGIPPFFEVSVEKKYQIDWETIDSYLGTTADKKLADKYNVSTASIWNRRIKMGIKAYRQPVNWEKAVHLFNKLSNMEIAKMYSVSVGAVSWARKKFGMIGPKKDLSFIDPYLDTLSDAEIAKKFGIKKTSVYHRRYLLKHRKIENK